MSSSGTAAEGEAAPAQPASEKEPDMPGPREESEEEDEDDDEEEEEEEEEKGGDRTSSFLVMDCTENAFSGSLCTYRRSVGVIIIFFFFSVRMWNYLGFVCVCARSEQQRRK